MSSYRPARFRASECHNLISRKRGDDSQLSLAGQKYVRQRWLDVEKGYRPPILVKQFTKGLVQEEAAIELLGKFIRQPLLPYSGGGAYDTELNFSGYADVITGPLIIDIKCPWDVSGLMEADLSKQYEWQLRAYMMLYDKPEAMLAYVLMDMPEDLWMDEKRKYCWKAGILDDSVPEVQGELDRLRAMYFYSDNPRYEFEERFRIFTFSRDAEKEELLRESLRIANEYYETVTLTNFTNENTRSNP